MKTIAIIGAMREEILPLLEGLGEYNEVKFGGNTYYIATYSGYNIVAAYSKIGKIHASITASTMIMKFSANYIIFTGVAGGLSGDLSVGDFVRLYGLCYLVFRLN